MRLEHFQQLQPVCPLCWVTHQIVFPVHLSHIALQEGLDIVEGTLVCSNSACQREHPIIDGIPVLLANAASWLESQYHSILRRHDLTPFTESILGDLAGPGSVLDRERGNNSIYAQAHWDPQSPTYLPLFHAALNLLAAPPHGLWLDIGCSVGRGTFELAAATGQLAIGVDLNFAMLRLAEAIRRTGRARYARRRVGVVYDPVDDPIPALPAQNVSFWCCDVAFLPFAAARFQGALAMNMLDCVSSPAGLLTEIGRVLQPGAEAILATPFDWSAAATHPAAWIGGHSQRSPHQGSSLAELRRILSADCQAGLDTGLTLEAEQDHHTWRLRTNERSTTEYDVLLARLRARAK